MIMYLNKMITLAIIRQDTEYYFYFAIRNSFLHSINLLQIYRIFLFPFWSRIPIVRTKCSLNCC